jgi:hypothetical protein
MIYLKSDEKAGPDLRFVACRAENQEFPDDI